MPYVRQAGEGWHFRQSEFITPITIQLDFLQWCCRNETITQMFHSCSGVINFQTYVPSRHIWFNYTERSQMFSLFQSTCEKIKGLGIPPTTQVAELGSPSAESSFWELFGLCRFPSNQIICFQNEPHLLRCVRRSSSSSVHLKKLLSPGSCCRKPLTRLIPHRVLSLSPPPSPLLCRLGPQK